MPDPEPLRDGNSEDARQAMLVFAPRILAREWVPLSGACGRVLATALIAGGDHPPFDAASMDGFAFAALGQEQRLTVIGESRPGRPFGRAVARGEAVHISTGSVLPRGADTVLPRESAVIEGETLIGNSEMGAFVRRAGGDFSRGKVLLPASHRLNPFDLALAATAGADRLSVLAKPRVAVIACGDEFVRPGAPLASGQIHESIGPSLAALVSNWGGRVVLSILLPDHREALAHAIAEARRDADLAVVIVGASFGAHDCVRDALGSDARLIVEKIAMRPGGGAWFGVSASAPVLGLPGNPVSALVAGTLFLQPLLGAMLGLSSSLHYRSARLAQPLAANGECEHFMPARRVGDAVLALDDQDTSLLTALRDSTCLIRRAAHAVAAEAGAEVEVLHLEARC